MSGGLLQLIVCRQRRTREPSRAEAVLAHLATLLNTRRGMSSLDAEYGLPDLTEATHDMPLGLPVLQRMIVAAIERYEPRLQHVVVRAATLQTETLSLLVELSAQLPGAGTIRFETRVFSGGQISIR
jgi:type VI secretion system protein